MINLYERAKEHELTSMENIDEQMQTAIDKVPFSLPSCAEQMYDLSGRRYNKTAGHYGIYVVNGQKKLLR